MLLIYEYYYDEVYKPMEIESVGEEKIKLESYQYRIARELAKEVEDSLQESERPEFVDAVHKMKREFNTFTELIGDGKKRKLKVNSLIAIGTEEKKSEAEVNTNVAKDHASDKILGTLSLDELKKYKSALEEGLISEEEYNKIKSQFLKL